MNTVYKIILVDDHVMVRTALKELIQKAGPYTVIQEFSTGRELVNAYPFAETPDLMILDLCMPDMDGNQVLQWMRDNQVNIKTLVLTLENNEDWIVRLFRMGIRGYLKKNSPAIELKRAIDDIIQYGYYHNEILTQALVAPDTSAATEQEKIKSKISDRQLEFLELICHAEEYTYDKIATLMGVHRRTVDGYRESLFEKFNVRSKTGLVLFAIKHNLVDL